MSVLVALTVGLVFWLSAWSFGVKSFDAFMVTILLTFTAVAMRIARPYVDQLLGRSKPAPSER